MKKLLLPFILISAGLFGQVPKAIVLEHFTNSRCSICASRNPALFTNLDNNPEVLHIAFHPSSPYANCIFSQHNASENDLRTNFYNVYGGTPRIVINGVVTNQNFSTATLFDPYKNQTSEFDLSINHEVTADSVLIEVVIRKVSAGASSFNLTVGIAEDTIHYNAPNGEDLHLDVFREFAEHNGSKTAPAVGDSIVINYQIEKRGAWNPNSIYAFAMLQDGNKALLQGGRSMKNGGTVGMPEMNPLDFEVYPIPASSRVDFDKFAYYKLIDVTGKVIDEGFGDHLNVDQLSDGMYFLRVNVEGSEKVLRLPVVH